MHIYIYVYRFPTDLNLESWYMPVTLNLKSSFFGVASLMHVRIAFVAGFLTHYLSQRETLPLETIAVETAALRTEIKTARESVQELQLGQDSCVWRLWVQQWLLRLSLVFDILLVVWIIWKYRIYPALRSPDSVGSKTFKF